MTTNNEHLSSFSVSAAASREVPTADPVAYNDDDDLPPNTCMVGAQQPNHVLRGLFLCQRCHRKIECREMALLCDAESRGNITSPQKERKRVLEERQENKREWASAKRIKDVEQKGLLAVQETERAKNRNFQTSRSRAIEENPESLQKYKDDYKRQALKAKPKANGFHRESINKKVKYPPFFIDRLTEALRILIQLYGQEYLYWNDIVDLFDRFLKHEQPRLAMYNETLYVVKILPNGSPFPYLDLEYRRVANVLLQQSKTQPAKWKVRDYQPVSTSGKLRQDLNGDVFNAVYSAIASKEDEKPVVGKQQD